MIPLIEQLKSMGFWGALWWRVGGIGARVGS